MKTYFDYFSVDSILRILIKERLKNARRRDRIQKLDQIAARREKYIPKISEEELQQYIPPRRQWVRPGPEVRCRYHQQCEIDRCNLECKNRQHYNSYDLLSISLKLTFKKLAKDKNNEYIKAIKILRDDILNRISDHNFTFNKPNIIAIPKDIDEGIYRPIAQYNLTDKIIISLTNRYYTDLFDSFFEDVSFAFRSGKNNKNHHKAFEKIINYNKNQKEKDDIWVSECDIQKFYDTVNHSIIKREFNKLIKHAKKCSDLCFEISTAAQNVFVKYLESYAFNKDIIKLNNENQYWDKIKGNSTDKHFGWINKDVLHMQYKKIGSARIGVPQGGALSGLIANIVLNVIDGEIINDNSYDQDLLYVRFCDDIVLMHPDKEKCNYFYDKYYKLLGNLKLFPHAPSELKNGYTKDFWKSKTKVNYCWSKDLNKFPWVGFVGYEINRLGDVRVRKKSIKKEIDKQRDWINNIIYALNPEKSNDKYYIEKAVIGRLTGMSVGFLEVYNWKRVEKDMCWVNGFKCINDNKFIRLQLRRLDRERNRQIAKLKRAINKCSSDNTDCEEIVVDLKNTNRQIREHVGKPFSYFYHGIEKNPSSQFCVKKKNLNIQKPIPEV